MKGKTINKLLVLFLTVAGVMSSPSVLAVSAAGNVAQPAYENTQDMGGTQETGSDSQPMEANGFISPEGDIDSVSDPAAEVSFGVVSDTHVRQDKATEKSRLAKAFSFFSESGMDRMVVAGDLTDNGAASEYAAWKQIKEENLTIPLIASMGNHENNSADAFTETTENKPNDHQVVNGYHFITLSPGSGELDAETGKGTKQGGGNYTYTLDWLEDQLSQAEADTPDKPIFVFFHHPIKNTFYVSTEWYGSGLDEIFKNHPHAVTFSGHIHSPNNMPTSIWQDGGYTAVNTVTLSYMEMESGMIYGSVPPNASQIAQGLVVEANGSRVTIKNYDFLADKWIPQTWTFDVTETLPYTDERAESAQEPYFADDAQLMVSEVGENSVKLTFDQAEVAENNVGDIVHSYRYDFINTQTQKVVKTFKTWSEYYLQPMPERITQKAPDLEGGTSYEVRIYAIDAYQKVSENYLSQTFKTTGESSSEPGFDDMVEGVPKADLLDVDFSDGAISDHSVSGNTFYGSDGSNIAMDEELGKYTARFTGKAEEAFLTDWSAGQYDQTNDDFTIESTFKVDKFSENYVDLFANMESAGIGFEIPPYDDESASLEAWVHVGGSYQKPTAAGALKYGEWNHGVITYDGSKVTLYVNGVKIASREATGKVKTPAKSSQYYVIGGDSGSNGSVQSPMTGAISTARMYSKALTAKQVSMLANRELQMIDTTKPVIQLESQPAGTGTMNKDYTIPAAQAADNSTIVTLKTILTAPDGSELAALTGENGKTEAKTVKLEKAGTYKLVYKAEDRSGNVETKSYEIRVKAGDHSKFEEAMLRALSIGNDELETYTEESVAKLMEALQNAMLITDESLQDEIDSVTKQLNDAVDGLVKKEEGPQTDKSALQDLFDEVKDITGNGYTEESYAAFDAARTRAEEILADKDADQTAVNKAYDELLNRKEELKPAAVKKYAEDILAAAAEADRTNATEEAAAQLDEAIAKVQQMLDSGIVKEHEMAAGAIEVLKAVGNLNPGTANIAGLTQAIQSAEVLNSGRYTQNSWAIFETAVEEGKALLQELSAAEQNEAEPEAVPAELEGGSKTASADTDRVNTALDSLSTAAAGLQEKSEEQLSQLLSQLYSTIAKADAVLMDQVKYKPDSLSGLQELRDEAKQLADSGQADEEALKAAISGLETLLGKVVNRADKTELLIQLAKASMIKTEEYTKESVSAFTAAFENAKKINSDENISDQSAVDKASAELAQAMEKLVKKDGGSGDGNDNQEPDGSGNNNGSNSGSTENGSGNKVQSSDGNSPAGKTPVKTGTTSTSVKTGDGASPVVPAVMAVLALAGITFAAAWRKKVK